MPIMNMACSNAVECGFATVGTPDMWLLPFLFRATPRLDLTGWSLRSEVDHHSDRAFERHTRPDPERYETRNALAHDHLSGQSVRVVWIVLLSVVPLFGFGLLNVVTPRTTLAWQVRSTARHSEGDPREVVGRSFQRLFGINPEAPTDDASLRRMRLLGVAEILS